MAFHNDTDLFNFIKQHLYVAAVCDILDELGYLPLGEQGKLLFHFISQRYETGSLIITSNLEFSRWVEVLHDPALTSALLDRLTHHSNIILFDGESYRFRESLARQAVDLN